MSRLTRKEFDKTAWKCSYEEYCACYCPDCKEEGCPHREAYRRVPTVDGGLGLCWNLRKIAISANPEVKQAHQEMLEMKKEIAEKKTAKASDAARLVPVDADCRGYTDLFECIACGAVSHIGCAEKVCDSEFCPYCGKPIVE